MRVPVWHEHTQPFADRVKVLGIIQEQHADRALLFMQWKNMDWPLMVDALNELEVPVVPITLFIDEGGIVRHVNPRPDAIEEFLSAPPPSSMPAIPLRAAPNLDDLRADTLAGNPDAARTLGMSLLKWSGDDALDEAVHAFTTATRNAPEHGLTWFQRGVAYRARFDSPQRKRDDFQNAIDAWQQALGINPNQYIWRRRIQQYGPRLDKPYPFYDWVEQARADITEGGDMPHELSVEPAGAELARPARSFEASAAHESREAHAEIIRDETFIAHETIVVPDTSGRNRSYRAHIILKPLSANNSHWNNEADPLTVYLDLPEGWSARSAAQTHANPTNVATSTESRHLEFELQADDDAELPATLHAYALYNVCEGKHGVCLFRRLDMEVEID